MATSLRTVGDFCWVNMLTPDPAGAMEFFGRVLGWTYFEIPGKGHGMRAGGRDVGGLFDLHGPGTPPGLPPGITVMIKVEDAGAACERVRQLGGTAREPFDIGGQLRMAVCHDPAGAKFDLWESGAMQGTDADRAAHGVPSWFETLTTDVDRATAFYSALFGWTPTVRQMPGMEYTTFKHGATDVAGLMRVPQEGIPAHWGTYFTVDDADEAARLTKELGGQVFVGPMDIPGVGRFAGLLSPQGVRFYAIKYLPRQGS